MRSLGAARPRLRPGGSAPARVNSWILAASVDTFLVLGAVTLVCGLAGIGDDNTDAVVLAGVGAACTALARAARRRVAFPERPPVGRVFLGIGLIWTALVLFGTAVYLATGALGRVDDAMVESAAGFTTTAVTLIDGGEVSRSILLWRAATSWVGGLVAILIGVVTLPAVLRSTALIGYTTGRRGLDLVPNAVSGTRRVLMLYSGFTGACVVAYLAVGLEPVQAVVVGLGTASTGGFTGRPDSLAGYGAGAQTVAAVGMLMAGAGVFVLWWLARGRLKPLWRSEELRAFVLLFAVATVAVGAAGAGGWGEAAFMAASTLSTTGFAMSDWTQWGAFASVVLLVGAGIGTMMGSPGGGMRVMRARLLMLSAGADLRRQLDPYAVVVVRRDGQSLSRRTLDRLGGHQIAYVVLIGFGALVLGAVGLSLSGSVWASVSAVSTLGPSVGEIGAFGAIGDLPRSARLALVPLMLGGRMSIPPLLAGLGLVFQLHKSTRRQLRIAGRMVARRFDARPYSRPGDG